MGEIQLERKSMVDIILRNFNTIVIYYSKLAFVKKWKKDEELATARWWGEPKWKERSVQCRVLEEISIHKESSKLTIIESFLPEYRQNYWKGELKIPWDERIKERYGEWSHELSKPSTDYMNQCGEHIKKEIIFNFQPFPIAAPGFWFGGGIKG